MWGYSPYRDVCEDLIEDELTQEYEMYRKILRTIIFKAKKEV